MRTYSKYSVIVLVGLVAVLAVAVAGMASESSSSINASFSIPSWISLSVVGDGDVGFGEIGGGGTYVGDDTTELRVLSTTSWTLVGAVLWGESTIPAGANTSIIDSALALSIDQTSGSWGIHQVSVAYELFFEDEALGGLPIGDYNLVIQYTATTD